MKLHKKLLFSFVLIVLLSAILFSLLSWSIDKNLLQYMGALRENRLNQYEQLFRSYFLTRGSWDGVETLLQGMAAEGGRRRGRGIGMGRNGPPSFTSGTPEELLLYPRKEWLSLILLPPGSGKRLEKYFRFEKRI